MPADLQHFGQSTKHADGLSEQCRICKRAANKRYYDRHKDKEQERARARYNADPELAKRKVMESYWRNRETILPKLRERARMRRMAYTEQERERGRQNYQKHREQRLAHVHVYHQAHPEVRHAASIRRKAREKNIALDFRYGDWKRALDYFDHKCAVCGQEANLWITLAADHWIPVTDPLCPGTIPGNIVPLCHSKPGIPAGIPCCNQSKWNKPPRDWLVMRFGQRKAKQITQRIQAYFDWLAQSTS